MPNTIPLTKVTSSQIAAIGHDPATNTLAIQFHPHRNAEEGTPGPVYHYCNFTAADFKKFSGAESTGSHFYQHIKRETKKYPYKKISS